MSNGKIVRTRYEQRSPVSSKPSLVREAGGDIEMLRQTICARLNDEQIAFFLRVARHCGLDPFKGQIVPVVRRAKEQGQWVQKMSIQTTIDGFRSRAAEDMDGCEGPFWCGEDGEWKEAWLSQRPPSAAKVNVYRKGCARPFTAVALWSGYAEVDYQTGEPKAMWKRMGPHMLGKCAEALALRKAFPQALGGIYANEEMAQADGGAVEVAEPTVSDAPALVDSLVSLQTPDDLYAWAKEFAGDIQEMNDDGRSALRDLVKDAVKRTGASSDKLKELWSKEAA